MKKNATHNPSDKSSNVKEISDGVYINLNRITTDEKEFDEAIEESFRQMDAEDIPKKSQKDPHSHKDSNGVL